MIKRGKSYRYNYLITVKVNHIYTHSIPIGMKNKLNRVNSYELMDFIKKCHNAPWRGFIKEDATIAILNIQYLNKIRVK